ncbi:MAG TPA: glycosyltransferase family 2 protein [Coleofasciculaceae cyanobacterium]|jgi:glycosyltransferase involved in cell wall biosynthesis
MKNLSIIIPTRNRQEFLKDVLEPFRGFGDELEIIVIDDASSEAEASSNESICSTIPNCKYVYLPKTAGAAAARNYGLDISSAGYIWFIDDDDIVSTQAIKDVLELVGSQSFFSQVILLPMTVMSNNYIIKKIVPSKDRNTFAKYRDIGHQVATSAAVFPKTLLLEIGGWDAALLTGQDTDLFLRVSHRTEDFKCLQTEPVIQNIGHSKRLTRAVIKQEIGKIQFLMKHWRILSIRRIVYYLFTFIVVAPLLNEPNLYRLRVKLLSR